MCVQWSLLRQLLSDFAGCQCHSIHSFSLGAASGLQAGHNIPDGHEITYPVFVIVWRMHTVLLFSQHADMDQIAVVMFVLIP